MDIAGYMADPNHCPNCKEVNMTTDDETTNISRDDGIWAESEIRCCSCGMEWTDKYRFQSFEVTKQPNDQTGEEPDDQDEEEPEEEDEEANA